MKKIKEVYLSCLNQHKNTCVVVGRSYLEETLSSKKVNLAENVEEILFLFASICLSNYSTNPI